MVSLKRKQKGFTVIELVIVVVVIVILALLVVTTFTGIKAKARDSERTSDITADQAQIEAYFAQNTKYPTLAEMNDSSWRATNMKDLDREDLRDPKESGYTLVDIPAKDVYAYHVRASDGVTPCDNNTNACTQYTLTATLESGSAFVKSNLN